MLNDYRWTYNCIERLFPGVNKVSIIEIFRENTDAIAPSSNVVRHRKSAQDFLCFKKIILMTCPLKR